SLDFRWNRTRELWRLAYECGGPKRVRVEARGAEAAPKWPRVESSASCVGHDRGCPHVGRFMGGAGVGFPVSGKIYVLDGTGADRHTYLSCRRSFIQTGENHSQPDESGIHVVSGDFRNLQIHSESYVLGFSDDSVRLVGVFGEPLGAGPAPGIYSVHGPFSDSPGRTCACVAFCTSVSRIPGQSAALVVNIGTRSIIN